MNLSKTYVVSWMLVPVLVWELYLIESLILNIDKAAHHYLWNDCGLIICHRSPLIYTLLRDGSVDKDMIFDNCQWSINMIYGCSVIKIMPFYPFVRSTWRNWTNNKITTTLDRTLWGSWTTISPYIQFLHGYFFYSIFSTINLMHVVHFRIRKYSQQILLFHWLHYASTKMNFKTW